MELIIMIFQSSSRPIIKGKVGNKDAYFLLDTGTNLALIDSTQTDKYNLEKGIEFSGNIIGTGGLGTKAYYCNTPLRASTDAASIIWPSSTDNWDKWDVIVNDLKVDTFEYRELIDYLTNYGK